MGGWGSLSRWSSAEENRKRNGKRLIMHTGGITMHCI